MFFYCVLLWPVVCDIGGKKGGDACEQERARIFQDRAHCSSQEGQRRGQAVKMAQKLPKYIFKEGHAMKRFCRMTRVDAYILSSSQLLIFFLNK